MSLYRKYRPQTFSHLVGQNHINTTLLNALKLDRVSHAYLFTGPRGTGKTSTARLMAKAINCLDPKENEPCNVCEICTEINDGRLIDLIEIDAASNRGIDEIRELRDKINFSPSRAKSKVYIIDEVHMLTKEAFNALLKTLEEPPSHVYFILATTEAHKIPETILSRCQRFDFKRIEDSVLMDRLKYIATEEGIQTEDKALELIVHNAEGALRDGIGLLEQLSIDKNLTFEHVCDVLGVSGIASMENLYGYLQANDAVASLKEISDLYEKGFDLLFFNKRFLEYLRRKMIKAVETNNNLETTRLLNLIENFRTAYEQTRYSTIPQLPLEIAVVKSVVTGGFGGKAVGESTATKMESPMVNSQAEPSIIEPAKVVVTPASTFSSNQNEPLPTADSVPPVEALNPNERVHQKILPTANISFETIKNNWIKIVNKTSSPIAKRCLQQGVPARLEGSTLVLAFSNKFNMEKLMETINRSEAEKTIYEVTGHCVKINTEINEIAAKADKADKEFEDTVMDIFEGEVV